MSPYEKLIAVEACRRLINAGYYVTVDYDRGYEAADGATDINDKSKLPAIIEAMNAVDECWLMVGNAAGQDSYEGFVYFIWSNGDEGRTCISDWSTNLSSLIEPWYMVDTWANAQMDRAIKALDLLPDAITLLAGTCPPRDRLAMVKRMKAAIK